MSICDICIKELCAMRDAAYEECMQTCLDLITEVGFRDWLLGMADSCSQINAELGNGPELDFQHGFYTGQAKAYRAVLAKLGDERADG